MRSGDDNDDEHMSILSTLYKCLRLRLQDTETQHRGSHREADENCRGMPQLLSEEEKPPVLEAGKKDDMHAWMHEEDERRRRLIRLADEPAPAAPPRRLAVPGANVAFQLAQRGTRHVYCCGACGERSACAHARPTPTSFHARAPPPRAPAAAQARISCGRKTC